ncbi:MAG: hypothetical protein Aurels2KO_58340 [Aureliella sp.]
MNHGELQPYQVAQAEDGSSDAMSLATAEDALPHGNMYVQQNVQHFNNIHHNVQVDVEHRVDERLNQIQVDAGAWAENTHEGLKEALDQIRYENAVLQEEAEQRHQAQLAQQRAEFNQRLEDQRRDLGRLTTEAEHRLHLSQQRAVTKAEVEVQRAAAKAEQDLRALDAVTERLDRELLSTCTAVAEVDEKVKMDDKNHGQKFEELVELWSKQAVPVPPQANVPAMMAGSQTQTVSPQTGTRPRQQPGCNAPYRNAPGRYGNVFGRCTYRPDVTTTLLRYNND